MTNSESVLQPPSAWRTEFAAAFVLTYLTTTVVFAEGLADSFGPSERALAIGGSTAVVVYVAASRGPGLGNPALLFGLMVVGRVTMLRGIRLLLAQLAGACLGALVARGPIPEEIIHLGRSGAPMWGDRLGWTQAITVEFLLTSIAVGVLLAGGMAREGGGWGWRAGPTAALLGLLAGVFTLVAGPLTGGIAHPGRSLGPALVGRYTEGSFVYVLGPLAGAALACSAWEALGEPRKEPNPPETAG